MFHCRGSQCSRSDSAGASAHAWLGRAMAATPASYPPLPFEIERAEGGDYGEIERLLALLSRPFDEQPEMQVYAAPPPEWGRRIVVSCSS